METDDKSPSGLAAGMLRRALDTCRRALQPDGPPVRQQDEPDPGRPGQHFSNEFFARLLLELPSHRRTMGTAYNNGDYRRLGDNVHQLLGATAYCDAPELDSGLRALRQALQDGDRDGIDLHFIRAIQAIDNTLRNSGCHGGS